MTSRSRAALSFPARKTLTSPLKSLAHCCSPHRRKSFIPQEISPTDVSVLTTPLALHGFTVPLAPRPSHGIAGQARPTSDRCR